ncbi:MAG: PDR/VanB family oxidoreductase [Alsobacter sp.]
MSASPLAIRVRVTAVEDVAPSVRQFRLALAQGGRLPPFSGGSHILVDIPDGEGVRRNAYSLAGSPDDLDHYRISVRREEHGRGGSKLLHDTMEPGCELTISQPANAFPLDWRARNHVFIAGGIGVTPFVAMAAQAAAAGSRFELHLACRSRAHAAHGEELGSLYRQRVRLYPSDEGRRLPIASVLAHQPLGTHLYVCGPASLIDETLATALALGWPEASLHAERFVSPPSGEPFRVRLARAGIMVDVGRHQSLLEAIEAAGVATSALCRGGACGQCRTSVLTCEGRLLHADHVLTQEERASGTVVMPCVSRFEGRSLILDL